MMLKPVALRHQLGSLKWHVGGASVGRQPNPAAGKATAGTGRQKGNEQPGWKVERAEKPALGSALAAVAFVGLATAVPAAAAAAVAGQQGATETLY
jgi:hypothetical protein